MLESFGCDNRKELATACNRHRSETDAEKELNEEGNMEEIDSQKAAL